jgi:hypothetical protein
VWGFGEEFGITFGLDYFFNKFHGMNRDKSHKSVAFVNILTPIRASSGRSSAVVFFA